MGITGLNPLIADQAPGAICEQYSLNVWSGYRTVVDANAWLHSRSSTAGKQVTQGSIAAPDQAEITRLTLRNLRSTLERFLCVGITPIFVFDGKADCAKQDELLDRSSGKQEAIIARDTLLEQLQSAEATTPEQLKQLNALQQRAGFLTADEFTAVKSVLSAIGIPWIQAPGEADPLCAALCREGYAVGCYGTDGDLLTHGCPFRIEKLATAQVSGTKHLLAKVYHLPTALSQLGLTLDQFQDLCILLGCDYNHKLYGVNPKDTLSLLKQYDRLDNIPILPKYRFDQVNVDVCRQMFRLRSVAEILGTELVDSQINLQKERLADARNTLEMWGCEDWITPLVTLYERLPIANNAAPVIYPRSVTTLTYMLDGELFTVPIHLDNTAVVPTVNTNTSLNVAAQPTAVPTASSTQIRRYLERTSGEAMSNSADTDVIVVSW